MSASTLCAAEIVSAVRIQAVTRCRCVIGVVAKRRHGGKHGRRKDHADDRDDRPHAVCAHGALRNAVKHIHLRITSSRTMSAVLRWQARRSACRAIDSSWVMTMSVCPYWRLEYFSSSTISCDVLAVKVAGRLVRQHDGRRVDERAANGDALLLTAGKLIRQVPFAATQAERVQKLLEARVHSPSVHRSGRAA